MSLLFALLPVLTKGGARNSRFFCEKEILKTFQSPAIRLVNKRQIPQANMSTIWYTRKANELYGNHSANFRDHKLTFWQYFSPDKVLAGLHKAYLIRLGGWAKDEAIQFGCSSGLM